MAAYLLIEAGVIDRQAGYPDEFMLAAAIEKYQGRTLSRGDSIEVLEGRWTRPDALLIIEFASIAQAKTFYNSPEYGAARSARKNATGMNVLLVDGWPL